MSVYIYVDVCMHIKLVVRVVFLTVSIVGTEVGEKASPQRFNGRDLMTEDYLFVFMITYIYRTVLCSTFLSRKLFVKLLIFSYILQIFAKWSL